MAFHGRHKGLERGHEGVESCEREGSVIIEG